MRSGGIGTCRSGNRPQYGILWWKPLLFPCALHLQHRVLIFFDDDTRAHGLWQVRLFLPVFPHQSAQAYRPDPTISIPAILLPSFFFTHFLLIRCFSLETGKERERQRRECVQSTHCIGLTLSADPASSIWSLFFYSPLFFRMGKKSNPAYFLSVWTSFFSPF